MKFNAVDGYIRGFDRAKHDNPLHIFKHYGVSGCIILFDPYSYYLGKLSILEKKWSIFKQSWIPTSFSLILKFLATP